PAAARTGGAASGRAAARRGERVAPTGALNRPVGAEKNCAPQLPGGDSQVAGSLSIAYRSAHPTGMSMAATRLEPPRTDDVALASALLRREPRAAAEVWSAYAPMVLRFVRRFFGPS